MKSVIPLKCNLKPIDAARTLIILVYPSMDSHYRLIFLSLLRVLTVKRLLHAGHPFEVGPSTK